MIQVRNSFFVVLSALIVALSSGVMQALDVTPVVVESVDLDKEMAALSSLLSDRAQALGLDSADGVGSRFGNAGKVAAFSTLMAIGVGIVLGNTVSHCGINKIHRFYDKITKKLGLSEKSPIQSGTVAGTVDGFFFGVILAACVVLSSQAGTLPALDAKKLVKPVAIAAGAVPVSCLLMAAYRLATAGEVAMNDVVDIAQDIPLYAAPVSAALLSAWIIKQRFDLGCKRQEFAQLVRDIAACQTLEDSKSLREKIIALA